MASHSIVAYGETVRVSGVSLLFCDLVGSTALLAQLGEKANDEVRRDLFEALRQPIAAFHGTEVKSQGDGLMVAFRTSAKDAFGCAVAMQQAVVRLSSADGCPHLAIRVGISMGEVTSEDRDWFGTPVVEAARLCGLAKPGQILVTDHMVRTRGGVPSADTRSVGLLTMKGFPNPVACSEIVAPSPIVDAMSVPLPSAFDLCGQPPAVGIGEQLGEVRRVWGDVVDGATNAVVVTGPPRSGKTRFVAELVNTVTADTIDGGGSYLLSIKMSQRITSWADVIGEMFRRHVMWGPPPLVQHLAEVPGLSAFVPSLAVRLPDSTAVGADLGGYEPLTVLCEAIRRMEQDKPVVVVLEDIQRTTVDVAAMLTSLMRPRGACGLLLVVTYRDADDQQDVSLGAVGKALDEAGASRIVLGPLGRRDVRRLVGSMWNGSASDVYVTESIFGLVGGVAGDVIEAVVRLQTVEASGGDAAARRALSPCLPYKGLLALGEHDDAVFFGRGELVEQIAERLTSNHFVALVGASGSGKSSVLRAGVANAVRSSGRQLTVVTPSDRDEIRAAAAGTIHVGTLIIDQFEEFFTLWDDTDRSAVIEGLFSALSYGPIEAIAVGIRSDFFGQCADHPSLVSRLGDATVLVGSLTEHELRAMIEGPAEAGGLILDSGFASMIQSDLGDERHPLPLLSHALYETWRRRATPGHLTVDDYHDAGGIRGSIARTAERVFAVQLDPVHQRCARDLLLRLVEPGDEHRPATRRPVQRGVLADTFGEIGDEVIGVFVRARLLVADDDMIDLAHEAILSEWPRLAMWIAEDREQLITAAHLARSAQEWVTKSRPQTDLYRGTRLDAARDLAETGRPLTSTEREFVAASLELRDRERVQLHRTNRRLRRQLDRSIDRCRAGNRCDGRRGRPTTHRQSATSPGPTGAARLGCNRSGRLTSRCRRAPGRRSEQAATIRGVTRSPGDRAQNTTIDRSHPVSELLGGWRDACCHVTGFASRRTCHEQAV